MHPLRRLLHRGARATSGSTPRRSPAWPSSGARRSTQFSRKFVRRVGDDYSLIEKPGGDCIFWDKRSGCTVYPARPVQCQTWPFWPENIATPDDWARVDAGLPRLGPGPGLRRRGDPGVGGQGAHMIAPRR